MAVVTRRSSLAQAPILLVCVSGAVAMWRVVLWFGLVAHGSGGSLVVEQSDLGWPARAITMEELDVRKGTQVLRDP